MRESLIERMHVCADLRECMFMEKVAAAVVVVGEEGVSQQHGSSSAQ